MLKNNKLLMVLGALLSMLTILYVIWRIQCRVIFIEGINSFRWEYLGENKSRICCGLKTLVGPSYLEIAETDRFIYGGDWQSFWFAIDKKNKCVFRAERIEELRNRVRDELQLFNGGDSCFSPRLMNFNTRKNIERFGRIDGR